MSAGGTVAPASRRICVLQEYNIISADEAHAGESWASAFLRASASEFFAGEYVKVPSIDVNETLASGGSIHGRSCIMHSRRVGDFNIVRDESIYLGLTNSGMIPPVT
eukprot:scaffold115951_cov36-Tisochrysis_lutea.AAC.2